MARPNLRDLSPICRQYDCFANETGVYGTRICTALTDSRFKNHRCPFYKSKRQYQDELDALARKRMETLPYYGDLPEKKDREMI